MGIKAQSSIVLMVFTILTIIVVISTVGLNWWIGGEKDKLLESKAEIQLSVYEVNNALTAAKSYGEASLDYSVYQAVYEVMANGGWRENTYTREIQGKRYSLWYNGNDSSPSLKTVKREIQSAIEDNLRLYTEKPYTFLDEYKVSFPEYTIHVEFGEKMKVKATSKRNLEITYSKDWGKVHLERNPLLEGTYEINIPGMLEKGKSLLSSVSARAEEIIKEVLENLRHGEMTLNEKGCNVYKDSKEICERVLGSVNIDEILSSTKRSIKEKLSSYLGSLNQDEKYRINAVVEDISLNPVMKGESSCVENKRTELRCELSYSADVIIKISVSERGSESYPVFNGKRIVISPIELVFLIEEEHSL